MKHLVRIFAIMLIAVIGCVEFMQFHHHDCYGHIFFMIGAKTEIGLGNSGEVCSHNHNGGDHTASGSGDEDCPMRHIQMIAGKPSEINCQFSYFDNIISEPASAELQVNRYSDCIISLSASDSCLSLPGKFCQINYLRAPPAV